MKTEELYFFKGRTNKQKISELEQENATLKAQRDELLEALKKIYLITSQAEPSGLIDEIWSISKEAIQHCK